MENRYEIDWEKYASLARQASAEGAVLLRNEYTRGRDGGKPYAKIQRARRGREVLTRRACRRCLCSKNYWNLKTAIIL